MGDFIIPPLGDTGWNTMREILDLHFGLASHLGYTVCMGCIIGFSG